MNNAVDQKVLDDILGVGNRDKKEIESILDDAKVHGLDTDPDTADVYHVLEDIVKK